MDCGKDDQRQELEEAELRVDLRHMAKLATNLVETMAKK